MPPSNQLKNQHLSWRAGFGPSPAEVQLLQTLTPKAYFQQLNKAASAKPTYLDVADNFLKGLTMDIDNIRQMQRNQLGDEDKKKIRKQNREDIKNLNLRWLNEMVTTNAPLREKMALFWHGHFASRNLNIFYQQLLLNVIRTNALGSFADLLREVSKSAAMINFLNNNQNRKGHPNENFAREVMELFTMGRGHYTEHDVKEAARAFTGWGANVNGAFVFRKQQHDTGSKTILGKTGNFNGDDVLDILLNQKQTAVFITRKIYRYFVNEQVNEEKVQWLANRFYTSNYNIAGLMEDIFTSNWFYDAANIGCKIKSPVELLVGIRRTLPMTLENESAQLLIQRLLGQMLFYPPNVAGWPGDKNWIDSSSLMLRLRLPQMIQDEEEIKLTPKADDDTNMGMKEINQTKTRQQNKGMGRQLQANIDWNTYIMMYKDVSREALISKMADTLLQTQQNIDTATLQRYADSSSRENFIKTITIELMSTPEYQMC